MKQTPAHRDRTGGYVNVALLGPVARRTPPWDYGPWEQVTGMLAEGLVARGVDVTLFATLDSVTSARLDGICPGDSAEDRRRGTWPVDGRNGLRDGALAR